MAAETDDRTGEQRWPWMIRGALLSTVVLLTVELVVSTLRNDILRIIGVAVGVIALPALLVWSVLRDERQERKTENSRRMARQQAQRDRFEQQHAATPVMPDSTLRRRPGMPTGSDDARTSK